LDVILGSLSRRLVPRLSSVIRTRRDIARLFLLVQPLLSTPPTFSLKLLSYISACIQSLNTSVLPRLLSISYILKLLQLLSTPHLSLSKPIFMSSRPLILCDRVSAEPSPYAKIITHWAHSPSSFLLPSISLTFHSLAWQVYSERPLSSGGARSRAHQV